LSGVGVLAGGSRDREFRPVPRGLVPDPIGRQPGRWRGLEARVGVRLFDRTPRAVTLTDEGRQIPCQWSPPLLAEIEDAATAAAVPPRRCAAGFRVNVDPWFARQVLAPHLPAFMAAYPELSLDVMVHDRLGDMVGDGIDVALRFRRAGTLSIESRAKLVRRPS